MLPSADFFNPDKTFKSADEIRRMLAYLGVKPEQRIHTYCGGGVAASVPFFALKFLLGYPKVTLYQESEMGWLSDERELPFWTYDAPFLMRESSWVQSWGGQRLRMYRVANVSIVDVRPAAAFDQGHVPFALNDPGRRVQGPSRHARRAGRGPGSGRRQPVSRSGCRVRSRVDQGLGAGLRHAGETGTEEGVRPRWTPCDAWAQRGFPATKNATVVGRDERRHGHCPYRR